MSPLIQGMYRIRIMTGRFFNAVLAALNESREAKEDDWSSIEAVLREPANPVVVDLGERLISENRFAAAVSSGMAKVRSTL